MTSSRQFSRGSGARKTAHHTLSRRTEWGHSLLELTVSMAVSGLLASGFFGVFIQLSGTVSQQAVVSQFQDDTRASLYQVARDLRLAGANPTANDALFDLSPSTDVAVDIDPDRNGDVTDAILVRADKTGSIEDEGDGDVDDSIETVMYHWEKESKTILRHVWRIPSAQSGTEISQHTANVAAFDATPFVEGVCDFRLTYMDSLNQPTKDSEAVAIVVIALTSASGPSECNKSNSFTRVNYATVRIRNR